MRRIYNRCIVDELERKDIELPFDLTEPLDVEWAGHPNWYFRISKFSIPYLKHTCVPKTWLLDQNSIVPRDNENYVLKPLYSFAGHRDQVRSHAGRRGCHTGRAASPLHSAGAYALRAGDRDAARHDPGRNSHDVCLA